MAGKGGRDNDGTGDGGGMPSGRESPFEDASDRPSPSKRPSAFPLRSPSLPPAGPRANYRIAFALVWCIVQAVLVVTSACRPDGAFGFRMFGESSSIKLALYREVVADGEATLVHVDDGVWSSTRDGRKRRHSWYDRVPMPYWAFDREIHASYGAATQLVRLQRALDDVTSHLGDSFDFETRRLVLDVLVKRNGRDAVVHRLTGPTRDVQREEREGR